MNWREYVKIEEERLRKEIDGEYFDLYYTQSCLDGNFTSDQLRKIADAMDNFAHWIITNANNKED